VDEQIISDFKDHFMFISCIDYICKVKTGHFGEHSNQLWSITDVPSWVKINAGLVKMYQKEVRRVLARVTKLEGFLILFYGLQ